MFEELEKPFDKARLYYKNKCYSIRGGYLKHVSIFVDDGCSKVYKIQGFLHNVDNGLIPTKAGKHSYVVTPVSKREGTLEIDNKIIECHVKDISIYEGEEDINSLDNEGRDICEIVNNRKVPLFVILSLKFPEGAIFRTIYKKEETNIIITPKELSRFEMMDFDE